MNEKINIIDTNSIEVAELPDVITTQFDKLTMLEANVQESVGRALEAKKRAKEAQVEIGFFECSKKEAINLLQVASSELAEGLIATTEAQQVSFDYQIKLTKITKFLFDLGISNTAMNRSVVRELELKLKGASEEEISDLARQELKNVVMQLKAQEDIMSKHDKLTEKVKICKNELLILENKTDKENERIKNEINIVEERLKKIITDLKSEAIKKEEDTYNKLTDLKDRIDKIDVLTSKLFWKIGVSVIAIGSLILNILQICNVI